MKEPLMVTIIYGEGYIEVDDKDIVRVIEGKTREKKRNYEIETKNFDINDNINNLKRRIYDFPIKKIYYSQTNEYIESLKIVSRDRKSGKLISLLETFEPTNIEQIRSIEFHGFEYIINIIVWIKDKKLTGFELKTNSNRKLKIGHGEKGQEIIIPEFEKENNVIVGFGVDANKKRVNSIYFYYINKNRYFDKYCCPLLFLRAIIKKNKDFIKNIRENKPEIYERYKFIIDVCSLPEVDFFPIASYFF